MENKNEKTVSSLNGLIEINNDRISGYEKASQENKDGELKSLFTSFASDSRKNRGELLAEVIAHSGRPAEGTTNAGKIFRAWMDIKATLKSNDSKAILESCEFGEDAAVEAYDDVLESDNLTSRAREVVARQKATIKQAHDKIKMKRDAYKIEASEEK